VALFAGLVYLAGALLPVAPAQASTLGNMICDDGEACVWDETEYRGCFVDFLPPEKDSNWNDGDPRWTNCEGGLNDKVSSYQNRSEYWFIMYQQANFVGYKFCAVPGGESNQMSHHKGSNNQMSSHTWSIGTPPRCLGSQSPNCCRWRDEE
jgi:hypothetical protein